MASIRRASRILLSLQRERLVGVLSLLGSGMLLAVTTNLSKVAQTVAVSPLAYLAWSLLGAALLLHGAASGGRAVNPRPARRRTLEYFFVAGFLTIAASNLIFFNAVRHLGVSFIALMFALPPLLTYAGALLLRLERFDMLRALGVALALAGTLHLVLDRWNTPGTDPVWLALCLLAPVMIAAGNLYRTCRWPPGASALSLVPGMLLAAFLMLAVFAGVSGQSLALAWDRFSVLGLVVLQSAVFAAQFLLLLILQRNSGPVFLSLIGSVAAVFGVPIAVWVLSEPLQPGFPASAALVGVGVGLTLAGAATGGEALRARPLSLPATKG